MELRGDFSVLILLSWWFFSFVSLGIQHSALVSLLAIPTVSLQALQDLTRTKINRRLVLRSRFQSVLVKLKLILCFYDLCQLLREEKFQVRSQVSFLRHKVSFCEVRKEETVQIWVKMNSLILVRDEKETSLESIRRWAQEGISDTVETVCGSNGK